MSKLTLDDEEEALKPVKRSARVERILRKREPQLVEGAKHALIMKGHHTSQVIIDVLRDLARLTKPHSKMMNRKNEILPFEDANSIEFLGGKNDCSLFALGSHSKKRPHNLIMGRTFDGHILDMIEFGVDSLRTIETFTGSKKAVGSKPLFVFNGSQWESDSLYARIQNLLLDFFRGTKLDKLSLQGIDHVICCSIADGKIYMRVYTVLFRKSGTKIPNVELIGMGPYLDLTVRRTQLASDDMWKTACKQPASTKPTKVKNVTKTVLGEKLGRIHMKKQNLDKMGGRRVTALRGDRPRSSASEGEVDSAPESGAKRRKLSSKSA